jgi:hypothetical protein
VALLGVGGIIGAFSVLHRDALYTWWHRMADGVSRETNEVIRVLPPRDAEDSDSTVRQIKFGERVVIDDFGPAVINSDCSASYIENWSTLTEHERETTRRRIGARNRERYAECRRRESDGEL